MQLEKESTMPNDLEKSGWHDLEKMTVVGYSMALKELSTIELAALNNAVQTTTRVDEGNLAFGKAVGLRIINLDGTFHDLLRSAAAWQFTERMKAENGEA